jgi:hypothetical protein
MAANPRKFSEKIALHKQKEAEEKEAFERIMAECKTLTDPRTGQPSQAHRSMGGCVIGSPQQQQNQQRHPPSPLPPGEMGRSG